jgi:hypothetical protein
MWDMGLLRDNRGAWQLDSVTSIIRFMKYTYMSSPPYGCL